MSAEVIDLAERREIRRLLRETDELLERSRRTNFEYSDELQSRTLNVRYNILAMAHTGEKQAELREMFELALLKLPPLETLEHRLLAIATATMAMLGDEKLVDELSARVASRRGAQYETYQRLLKEYGPGIFEVNSIS
jgi:hypothetical protein